MRKFCTGESYALSQGEKLNEQSTERLPNRSYLSIKNKECLYTCILPSLGTESRVESLQSLGNGLQHLVLMQYSIYELYLYAFNLAADFPATQILEFGTHRQYSVCTPCKERNGLCFAHRYDFELVMPLDLYEGQYRALVVQHLNAYFGLDVKLEYLPTVAGSRLKKTAKGEHLELIWDEQPVLLMKSIERKTSQLENLIK